MSRRPIDPPVDPLTERSRDVWARWRVDRERRELQQQINAATEAREAANLPIYPRECAERLADETARCAPDWRHVRPTLGPAWGRLLRAQPELSPEIVRQREQTITAVFNSVPPNLRPCVADLRTLIDLLLIGHEVAAYQVGFESGRRVEQMRDPRTRGRGATREGSELRLHAAEIGGAR